jgi:hypothetical protein
MDDSDSGSGFQTLASVLAGGLAGYVDSQNNQPIYVAQPQPQTAYGISGVGQPSVAGGGVASIGGIPPMVLLLGLGVIAFIALRK